MSMYLLINQKQIGLLLQSFTFINERKRDFIDIYGNFIIFIIVVLVSNGILLFWPGCRYHYFM